MVIGNTLCHTLHVRNVFITTLFQYNFHYSLNKHSCVSIDATIFIPAGIFTFFIKETCRRNYKICPI